MATRTHLGLSVFALLAALLVPSAARADDEAPEPARSRTIRIKLHNEAAPPALPLEVSRDPLDTVRRWMMTRAVKAMGHVADGTATTPLHAWFDGGDDVPLADLRNALKADGWTADELLGWLGQHVAATLQRLLSDGANQGRSSPAGEDRAWFAPRRRGPGRGAPEVQAPDRRGALGDGPARRRRMRNMRGMRGMRGARGPGGDGPPQAAAAPQPRALLLLHDGSGWTVRELPAGAPGLPRLQGPPAGRWPYGGGAVARDPQGAGVPPPWLEMLKSLLPQGAAGREGAGPDLQQLMELWRRVPSQGAPPPRMRVKSAKPKAAQEVVIEEEVEVVKPER